MRVTVCELSNESQQLARDWEKLSGHVHNSSRKRVTYWP